MPFFGRDIAIYLSLMSLPSNVKELKLTFLEPKPSRVVSLCHHDYCLIRAWFALFSIQMCQISESDTWKRSIPIEYIYYILSALVWRFLSIWVHFNLCCVSLKVLLHSQHQHAFTSRNNNSLVWLYKTTSKYPQHLRIIF